MQKTIKDLYEVIHNTRISLLFILERLGKWENQIMMMIK